MLGGLPPGKKSLESENAIVVDVPKYLNRNTGVKTITDLVITTNKGSEPTEVKRSPDTLNEDTETATYCELAAYLVTAH